MSRIYEWIKVIFKEKVSLFIKGCFGGGFISYIFLFNSPPVNDIVVLILTIAVKIIVIVVSGLLSGFATVAGNDLYKAIKSKWNKWLKKRKK